MGFQERSTRFRVNISGDYSIGDNHIDEIDDSPRRAKLQEFMQDGEEFLGNFRIDPPIQYTSPSLRDLTLPLKEKLIRMRDSGKYTSLRVVPEAAMDLELNPIEGSAAVFGIRKQVPPQQ